MSTPQAYIFDAALSLSLAVGAVFVVASGSTALSVAVAGLAMIGNLVVGAALVVRATAAAGPDAAGPRSLVALKQLATVPLVVLLLGVLGPAPVLIAVCAVVAGFGLRLGVGALHEGLARSLTPQES